MRKVDKQGFIKGEPQQLTDGIEIARWVSSGGASWFSLVERFHPTVGAHWAYFTNDAGGGFTQLEGYDRHRAYADCAQRVARANQVSNTRMNHVLNVAGIDHAEAESRLRSAGERLLIMANWKGISRNFFVSRVADVADACGLTNPHARDALFTAGLKANILYLVNMNAQGRAPAMSIDVLELALAEAERMPNRTPADEAALRLIDQSRDKAAEQTLASYDFGGLSISGQGNWERVSGGAERHIDLFIGSGAAQSSDRVSFTVRFDGHSVVPSDVVALRVLDGTEIGLQSGEPGADPVPGFS